MSCASPTRPRSAPDELEAGQVHVWTARLDDHLPRLAALAAVLSADERERAERFRSAADADAYVVRRGLLRELLGGYLGVFPGELRFSYGRWGRPDLAGAERLSFNASSSGGLALYAFALDRAVGVDIERVRDLPDLDEVAERIHSPAERAAFADLPRADRVPAFFATWTQKEAYVKAIGDGFAAPLDTFAVPLSPDPGAPTRIREYTVQALPAPAGYAAAVAADGSGWHVVPRALTP